jgi:hypothetical protein
LTDLDGASYASFGRRFAAWLIDVAILLSVVLLVAITLRILRIVGIWVPAGAGMPPEGTCVTLGFNAKLFVVSCFVVSMGPIYFVLC